MANLISYENWVDTYRPITNHLYDIGQVDGFMFETYKSQLAFVQKQNPQNVWALIWNDELDADFIIPNWCVANSDRIGFLITKVPWENSDVEVLYADFNNEWSDSAEDESEAA